MALGRPLLGGDRRAKSESREGGTARKVARGSPQPPLSHVWRTRTAEAIAGAGSRRMDSFFSHRSFVCHGLNWGKKARAACLRNPGILDSSKGRQLPARFPRFRVARLVCSLSPRQTTTRSQPVGSLRRRILRNQRTYTFSAYRDRFSATFLACTRKRQAAAGLLWSPAGSAGGVSELLLS